MYTHLSHQGNANLSYLNRYISNSVLDGITEIEEDLGGVILGLLCIDAN